MFEYKRQMNQVTITGYTGTDPKVDIPPIIDGHPVTALGDYAFSDTTITAIALPETLKKVGRYAFYNCFSLDLFSFTHQLEDVGAGAFTGCHNIRHLTLFTREGSPSCLKEVLLELPEPLTVDYYCQESHARLIFPEYYEEGIENTPARIIEHRIHGSGMHYRNCFQGRVFQFQEYDLRFPMAVSQEKPQLVMELVLARLQFPYQLSKKARELYTIYLREHTEDVLKYLTEKKDAPRLSFFMEFKRRHLPSLSREFSL